MGDEETRKFWITKILKSYLTKQIRSIILFKAYVNLKTLLHLIYLVIQLCYRKNYY